MIKFSGRVDNKAKSRVIKQRDRQVGWMMLFGSTMGVLFNIYWIFTKKTLNSGLLASVAVLILLTIAIFVVPSTGVAHGVDWFYTVCIENGTIQKTQFGHPPLLMKIDQIKKVIDDGEYYTVIYSGLRNAIICQKSLLVEGTFEEFEEVFHDKLKRRKRLRRKKEDKTSEKKDEKNL